MYDTLSPDTQSTLTLIGALGGKKITPSPLSSRELYNRQRSSNALS